MDKAQIPIDSEWYIPSSEPFRVYLLLFIASGDYNAKHTAWGSRLITPRGQEVHKWIEHLLHLRSLQINWEIWKKMVVIVVCS
jgi:hypothetical protein